MIGEALRQRPEAKNRLIISTKAGRSHEGYDYSFDENCSQRLWQP